MAKTNVVTRASAGKASEKTFIVTGGNTGLGFECASSLANKKQALGESVSFDTEDRDGINAHK